MASIGLLSSQASDVVIYFSILLLYSCTVGQGRTSARLPAGAECIPHTVVFADRTECWMVKRP